MDGIRAKNALEISRGSYYTIVMSGTPIPNSYMDIKNWLETLYHDEYNEYFGFSEAQLKNPGEDDMLGINSRIQPFFCRTTKKQLEVPDANDDIIIKSIASNSENEIFNSIDKTSKFNDCIRLAIKLYEKSESIPYRNMY